MTSSLVGSEMCIRDSCPSPEPPSACQCLSPPCNNRCSCCRVACAPPGPVSYTHLTLPTICSV
eukprot:2844861-Prorocentrum_lima.AAC.1